MAKKQEKLMLGHMISEDEKYNKLKKVTFSNGLFTEVYRSFRPSKIDAMLLDFTQFKDEYDKTQGEMSEVDILSYLSLFVVLHFSTIVGDLPETFEERLDVFGKILDSEYGERIAESFDQKELMKVNSIIFKKLLAFEKLKENENMMKNKFREEFDKADLKNRDVLEAVFFKDENVGNVEVESGDASG